MDFTALRNGTVLTIPVTIGSSAESGKGKLHTVRSSGEDLVSHQHESKSFTISVKEVEVPKCATPTISYSNDKLTFSCETEGAECHYSIADSDIQTNVGNEVALTKAYAITVYATKSGYDNSDNATATLTWIDVDPNNVITGAGTIQAKAIMIHSSGKTIYVSGAPQGTPISVYDTAGRMAGSAVASADKTTGISTTIGSGEIAIVKIGEKSVKVVIK